MGLGLGDDLLLSGLVGQMESELGVQVRLVGWVSLGEDGGDACECVESFRDLLPGHRRVAGRGAKAGLGGCAFGVDRGGPSSDEGGLGAWCRVVRRDRTPGLPQNGA